MPRWPRSCQKPIPFEVLCIDDDYSSEDPEEYDPDEDSDEDSDEGEYPYPINPHTNENKSHEN